MAVIPTIDPTMNRMTTEVGAVKQSTQIASIPGSMLSELGQGVKEIADQLTTIQAHSEHLQAQNAYEAEVSEIKLKAKSDTDTSFEGRQKYYDAIDGARDKAASINSIPLYKDQFKVEQEQKSNVDKAEVGDFYYKRIVDKSKAAMVTFKDAQSKNYINSLPGKEGQRQRETAINEMQKLIDFQVGAGLMTNEEASKIRLEEINKWNLSKLKADAITHPEFVRDNPDYYSGAGVDGDDIVKQQDVAEKRIKIQKEQGERDVLKKQIDNAVDMTMKLATGEMGWANASDVSAMMANGEIDTQFGEAWLGYLADSDVLNDKRFNSEGLKSHVEQILNARSKQDIANSIKEILTRKDVKKSDLSILVGYAKQKGDQLMGIDGDTGVVAGSKQVMADKVFQNVIDWSSTLKGADKARLSKEYMMAIANGKDEQQAAEEAKRKEVIALHPEVANYKETPTMIYNQDDEIFSIFTGNIEGGYIYPHKLYDTKSKTINENKNRETSN